MVTKTYLKPTYLRTYATLVTDVTVGTVVTVVTVVTLVTVATVVKKKISQFFSSLKI